MKVEVRFAKDEDGARIGEIAQARGFGFHDAPFDWSRVAPYWLVAEIAGEIAAAIQILVALPVARIDFLLVVPGLPQKRRGAVVKTITDAALSVCQRFGAQEVSSTIDEKLDSYLRVAQRRGWEAYGTAWLVRRRLR